MVNTEMTPPWHFGRRYAGQTLDWISTDTYESYLKMMQDSAHREYFERRGWTTPGAINYRINSQGFRGEEFEPGNCLVALGCSYSMGIGLPESVIWPTLVAQSLGLKCYNLSWPGTSADTCYMLARYWIPSLKPSLVVMAAPPKHRFDLITEDSSLPHETFMPGQSGYKHDFYIQQWFLNDRNADLNNEKNKLAVQALSYNLEIPCLTYDAHEYFARSREEVEYARDYMHAGPRGHQMFAERIIDDWRKKYT